MSVVAKVRQLFTRRERYGLAALTAAMIFGSVLEIFGVGLLLPLIEIVRDPQVVLGHPRFGPWLAEAGLADPRSVVIAVSTLFLAVFLVKSLYVAIMLRVLFGFVFRKTVALSKRLLEAYLKTEYTFHLHRNTSEMIRNATVEVNNLMGGVVQSSMYLVSESVVAAGLIGVLLYTSPAAALTGLLVFGLVGWGFTALVRRRLTRIGTARAEQEARMIQWVRQSLGGLKEIKVLGKEKYFVDAFTAAGGAFADAQRQNMLLAQYPRLAIEASLVVGLVGLVVVLLLTGSSVGNLVPVLALFGAASVRLIPSLTRLVTSINAIRYYLPSVEILHQDLTEATRRGAPADRKRGPVPVFGRQLRIENLTHQYAGSPAPALQGVSLEIPHGCSAAVVGPSGAGKTTLANLILGLLRPVSGRILVDGVDIQENIEGWQRQLGYIPQDSYLSDDSLRRNVAFGVPDPEIDDHAVWRALELAQLGDFVRGLKGGLDVVVGERGVRISGGQRQRIGIARALYHDPGMLVLDEATSALDQETEREFQKAIFGLLGKKTLLIIAHRLSTIRHCDTIFVLDGGKLVGAGSYADLRANNLVFRQLVESGESGSVI